MMTDAVDSKLATANYELTIKGAPRSKKNSMQIVKFGNRPSLIPSAKYREYEKMAGEQITPPDAPINDPVNVKMLFYMPTHRRVDLSNLISACLDILVKYQVLEDDNCNIVVTQDGSQVFYDKENPRTEVYITQFSGAFD